MEMDIDPIMGVPRYSNPRDNNEIMWLQKQMDQGKVERIDMIHWRERIPKRRNNVRNERFRY